MSKNSKDIGENLSNKLSGKYSQKLFGLARQSDTNAPNTDSKRAIQKTAEVTGDLTGNKIADKITKVSRTSPQNISETVSNETRNVWLHREIPRKKYPQNR